MNTDKKGVYGSDLNLEDYLQERYGVKIGDKILSKKNVYGFKIGDPVYVVNEDSVGIIIDGATESKDAITNKIYWLHEVRTDVDGVQGFDNLLPLTKQHTAGRSVRISSEVFDAMKRKQGEQL